MRNPLNLVVLTLCVKVALCEEEFLSGFIGGSPPPAPSGPWGSDVSQETCDKMQFKDVPEGESTEMSIMKEVGGQLLSQAAGNFGPAVDMALGVMGIMGDDDAHLQNQIDNNKILAECTRRDLEKTKKKVNALSKEVDAIQEDIVKIKENINKNKQNIAHNAVQISKNAQNMQAVSSAIMMLDAGKQVLGLELTMDLMAEEQHLLAYCLKYGNKHDACKSAEFSPFGGVRWQQLMHFGTVLNSNLKIFDTSTEIFKIMKADMVDLEGMGSAFSVSKMTKMQSDILSFIMKACIQYATYFAQFYTNVELRGGFMFHEIVEELFPTSIKVLTEIESSVRKIKAQTNKDTQMVEIWVKTIVNLKSIYTRTQDKWLGIHRYSSAFLNWEENVKKYECDKQCMNKDRYYAGTKHVDSFCVSSCPAWSLNTNGAQDWCWHAGMGMDTIESPWIHFEKANATIRAASLEAATFSGITNELAQDKFENKPLPPKKDRRWNWQKKTKAFGAEMKELLQCPQLWVSEKYWKWGSKNTQKEQYGYGDGYWLDTARWAVGPSAYNGDPGVKRWHSDNFLPHNSGKGTCIDWLRDAAVRWTREVGFSGMKARKGKNSFTATSTNNIGCYSAPDSHCEGLTQSQCWTMFDSNKYPKCEWKSEVSGYCVKRIKRKGCPNKKFQERHHQCTPSQPALLWPNKISSAKKCKALCKLSTCSAVKYIPDITGLGQGDCFLINGTCSWHGAKEAGSKYFEVSDYGTCVELAPPTDVKYYGHASAKEKSDRKNLVAWVKEMRRSKRARRKKEKGSGTSENDATGSAGKGLGRSRNVAVGTAAATPTNPPTPPPSPLPTPPPTLPPTPPPSSLPTHPPTPPPTLPPTDPPSPLPTPPVVDPFSMPFRRRKGGKRQKGRGRFGKGAPPPPYNPYNGMNMDMYWRDRDLNEKEVQENKMEDFEL